MADCPRGRLRGRCAARKTGRLCATKLRTFRVRIGFGRGRVRGNRFIAETSEPEEVSGRTEGTCSSMLPDRERVVQLKSTTTTPSRVASATVEPFSCCGLSGRSASVGSQGRPRLATRVAESRAGLHQAFRWGPLHRQTLEDLRRLSHGRFRRRPPWRGRGGVDPMECRFSKQP